MATQIYEAVIAKLGNWGFSAKAIRRRLRSNHNVRISVDRVYRILSKHEVRLRDYRDAVSSTGKKQMHKLDAPMLRRVRRRTA